MNYRDIDGQTKKIGEALLATASVWPKSPDAPKKIFFKLPGSMGTITYDIVRQKWYGAPRIIPSIKKEFGLQE